MKNIVFTFCTKNLEPFKINFYSNLKGNFEIIHEYIDVHIENKSGGGKGIWEFKISKILSLVDENINKECLIYIFDLDIQLFADITKTVNNFFELYSLDIAFQSENLFNGANIGICIIKPNERSKKFWHDVYVRLKNSNEWDQKVVNDYIWINSIENYKCTTLKIGILPKEFYACSHPTIPTNILLHHANCTTDFNEKWNQFEFVQRTINKKLSNKNLMQNFFESKKIYFSYFSSSNFICEECTIVNNIIKINHYGEHKISVKYDQIRLIKNGTSVIILDYFVHDSYHNKSLFMGFFTEIGKHNGTYNRCYFVSDDKISQSKE